MHEIPSPCTRVCRIDPASGWCIGCRRTLDEIADWGLLSRAEKLDLLAELEHRAIAPPNIAARPGG